MYKTQLNIYGSLLRVGRKQMLVLIVDDCMQRFIGWCNVRKMQIYGSIDKELLRKKLVWQRAGSWFPRLVYEAL